MSTMACTHSPQRKEIEVWLIDEEDLTLYRQIAGDKEEIIPIANNRSMQQFLCVSEDELYELVEDSIERETK